VRIRGRLPHFGEQAVKICTHCANLKLAFHGPVRYQRRMTDNTIDSLARMLAEAVPKGIRSVRDDLEKNFRSVLHSGLGRLDLVTREEFDVQQAVLLRTRQKLEALEARLAALEDTAGSPTAAGNTGGSKKGRSGKKKTRKKKKATGNKD
jgi:BMFP domain-containing protein YqiC